MEIKMKPKIWSFIIVALFLMGLVPQNEKTPEFISKWILIEAGINTSIPYKLPARAVDVQIWTPVYLDKVPDPSSWVQPVENLGNVKIVFVNEREIVISNQSEYPIWIQVYAR